MKYYRLIVSFVILVTFAGQMLLGDDSRSYTTQTDAAIGFCVNKEFQNRSKIDHNTSQSADISCTTSINLLFTFQEYSWESIVAKHSREASIFYQHILEQLYVDKLLEPPQTQLELT